MSTMEPHNEQLIAAATALAKTHMDGYEDPSHDWLHVQRVHSMAMRIADSLTASGSALDLLVVQLAAFLHDLHDSKYAAASDSVWEDLNARFFGEQIQLGRLTEDQARLVCKICENISYSKEVKRIKAGSQTEWHNICLELHCVQDADKLDAMGGIGIMRCAAFSASKKRPLLEPGNPSDSISHFHDKLLKLKDMMRTPLGKQMAERRHESMLRFLQDVQAEWEESSF